MPGKRWTLFNFVKKYFLKNNVNSFNHVIYYVVRVSVCCFMLFYNNALIHSVPSGYRPEHNDFQWNEDTHSAVSHQTDEKPGVMCIHM